MQIILSQDLIDNLYVLFYFMIEYILPFLHRSISLLFIIIIK